MNKEFHKFFSFTVFNEIENICHPLVKNFDCNLFIYQRNFVDEKAMVVKNTAFLCNNANALEFILKLRSAKREKAKYDYGCKRRQYVFLDSTQPQFSQMLHNIFDFNHILCRDEKIKDDEWEHFIIGTKSHNPSVINNYLNNIDFIDKFAIFFRDVAHKHIEKACNDRFASNRQIEKCNFYSLNKEDILPPKHFHIINITGEFVALTLAEMRCLVLFCRGKTAKEIAKIFNISFRTVERHLQNAKLKIKCVNRGELFDVLTKNNVVDMEL